MENSFNDFDGKEERKKGEKERNKERKRRRERIFNPFHNLFLSCLPLICFLLSKIYSLLSLFLTLSSSLPFLDTKRVIQNVTHKCREGRGKRGRKKDREEKKRGKKKDGES